MPILTKPQELCCLFLDKNLCYFPASIGEVGIMLFFAVWLSIILPASIREMGNLSLPIGSQHRSAVSLLKQLKKLNIYSLEQRDQNCWYICCKWWKWSRPRTYVFCSSSCIVLLSILRMMMCDSFGFLDKEVICYYIKTIKRNPPLVYSTLNPDTTTRLRRSQMGSAWFLLETS